MSPANNWQGFGPMRMQIAAIGLALFGFAPGASQAAAIDCPATFNNGLALRDVLVTRGIPDLMRWEKPADGGWAVNRQKGKRDYLLCRYEGPYELHAIELPRHVKSCRVVS